MGNLFEDRVVLVTGSGQGVGRSIALAFAEEGAIVVTNNRKPGSTRLMSDDAYALLAPEKKKEYDALQLEIGGDAESTAQMIQSRGGKALPIYCDISRSDDVKKMVRQIVGAYGTVHILVNVAGAFGGGPLTEITEAQWDRVNDIKPKGYFNVMKEVLPYMEKQHWGRIINCTSRAMMGDIIKMVDYCAANAGCVGLTQAAACEYFHQGVTVNAFSPWAKTRAAYESDFKANDNGIPGQREFTHSSITPSPDAVPPFLLYLCTDAAKDITGTVFTLAGKEVSINQFPVAVRTIKKFSTEYWTVDELKKQVPYTLLRGYQNILDVQ
jgi:3-oxoacyl-[acyl-carrier protein] reductase